MDRLTTPCAISAAVPEDGSQVVQDGQVAGVRNGREREKAKVLGDYHRGQSGQSAYSQSVFGEGTQDESLLSLLLWQPVGPDIALVESVETLPPHMRSVPFLLSDPLESVAVGTKLYVAGTPRPGTVPVSPHSPERNSVLYAFDFTLNEWSPPTLLDCRVTHMVVSPLPYDSQTIYMLCLEERWDSDFRYGVVAFNTVTQVYDRRSPKGIAPKKRLAPSVVAARRSLFFLCGLQQFVGDVTGCFIYQLDLMSNEWTTVDFDVRQFPSSFPSYDKNAAFKNCRTGQTCVQFDDKIFVFGGCVLGDGEGRLARPRVTSDFVFFDLLEQQWFPVFPDPAQEPEGGVGKSTQVFLEGEDDSYQGEEEGGGEQTSGGEEVRGGRGGRQSELIQPAGRQTTSGGRRRQTRTGTEGGEGKAPVRVIGADGERHAEGEDEKRRGQPNPAINVSDGEGEAAPASLSPSVFADLTSAPFRSEPLPPDAPCPLQVRRNSALQQTPGPSGTLPPPSPLPPVTDAERESPSKRRLHDAQREDEGPVKAEEKEDRGRVEKERGRDRVRRDKRGKARERDKDRAPMRVELSLERHSKRDNLETRRRSSLPRTFGSRLTLMDSGMTTDSSEQEDEEGDDMSEVTTDQEKEGGESEKDGEENEGSPGGGRPREDRGTVLHFPDRRAPSSSSSSVNTGGGGRTSKGHRVSATVRHMASGGGAQDFHKAAAGKGAPRVGGDGVPGPSPSSSSGTHTVRQRRGTMGIALMNPSGVEEEEEMGGEGGVRKTPVPPPLNLEKEHSNESASSTDTAALGGDREGRHEVPPHGSSSSRSRKPKSPTLPLPADAQHRSATAAGGYANVRIDDRVHVYHFVKSNSSNPSEYSGGGMKSEIGQGGAARRHQTSSSQQEGSLGGAHAPASQISSTATTSAGVNTARHHPGGTNKDPKAGGQKGEGGGAPMSDDDVGDPDYSGAATSPAKVYRRSRNVFTLPSNHIRSSSLDATTLAAAATSVDPVSQGGTASSALRSQTGQRGMGLFLKARTVDKGSVGGVSGSGVKRSAVGGMSSVTPRPKSAVPRRLWSARGGGGASKGAGRSRSGWGGPSESSLWGGTVSPSHTAVQRGTAHGGQQGPLSRRSSKVSLHSEFSRINTAASRPSPFHGQPGGSQSRDRMRLSRFRSGQTATSAESDSDKDREREREKRSGGRQPSRASVGIASGGVGQMNRSSGAGQRERSRSSRKVRGSGNQFEGSPGTSRGSPGAFPMRASDEGRDDKRGQVEKESRRGRTDSAGLLKDGDVGETEGEEEERDGGGHEDIDRTDCEEEEEEEEEDEEEAVVSSEEGMMGGRQKNRKKKQKSGGVRARKVGGDEDSGHEERDNENEEQDGEEEHELPPPLTNHRAMLHKSGMLIFGGSLADGSANDAVWWFDLRGWRWHRLHSGWFGPRRQSLVFLPTCCSMAFDRLVVYQNLPSQSGPWAFHTLMALRLDWNFKDSRWPSPTMSALELLRETKTWDVAFWLEESKLLRAHRAVMARVSPALKEIMASLPLHDPAREMEAASGGDSDTETEKEGCEPIIQITAVSELIFSKVLEAVYSNFQAPIDPEFAFEILEVAVSFEIFPLIWAAQQALSITHENVLPLLSLARRQQLQILRARCADFINTHFEVIETLAPFPTSLSPNSKISAIATEPFPAGNATGGTTTAAAARAANSVQTAAAPAGGGRRASQLEARPLATPLLKTASAAATPAAAVAGAVTEAVAVLPATAAAAAVGGVQVALSSPQMLIRRGAGGGQFSPDTQSPASMSLVPRGGGVPGSPSQQPHAVALPFPATVPTVTAKAKAAHGHGEGTKEKEGFAFPPMPLLPLPQAVRMPASPSSQHVQGGGAIIDEGGREGVSPAASSPGRRSRSGRGSPSPGSRSPKRGGGGGVASPIVISPTAAAGVSTSAARLLEASAAHRWGQMDKWAADGFAGEESGETLGGAEPRDGPGKEPLCRETSKLSEAIDVPPPFISPSDRLLKAQKDGGQQPSAPSTQDPSHALPMPSSCASAFIPVGGDGGGERILLPKGSSRGSELDRQRRLSPPELASVPTAVKMPLGEGDDGRKEEDLLGGGIPFSTGGQWTRKEKSEEPSQQSLRRPVDMEIPRYLQASSISRGRKGIGIGLPTLDELRTLHGREVAEKRAEAPPSMFPSPVIPSNITSPLSGPHARPPPSFLPGSGPVAQTGSGTEPNPSLTNHSPEMQAPGPGPVPAVGPSGPPPSSYSHPSQTPLPASLAPIQPGVTDTSGRHHAGGVHPPPHPTKNHSQQRNRWGPPHGAVTPAVVLTKVPIDTGVLPSPQTGGSSEAAQTAAEAVAVLRESTPKAGIPNHSSPMIAAAAPPAPQGGVQPPPGGRQSPPIWPIHAPIPPTHPHTRESADNPSVSFFPPPRMPPHAASWDHAASARPPLPPAHPKSHSHSAETKQLPHSAPLATAQPLTREGSPGRRGPMHRQDTETDGKPHMGALRSSQQASPVRNRESPVPVPSETTQSPPPSKTHPRPPQWPALPPMLIAPPALQQHHPRPLTAPTGGSQVPPSVQNRSPPLPPAVVPEAQQITQRDSQTQPLSNRQPAFAVPGSSFGIHGPLSRNAHQPHPLQSAPPTHSAAHQPTPRFGSAQPRSRPGRLSGVGDPRSHANSAGVSSPAALYGPLSPGLFQVMRGPATRQPPGRSHAPQVLLPQHQTPPAGHGHGGIPPAVRAKGVGGSVLQAGQETPAATSVSHLHRGDRASAVQPQRGEASRTQPASFSPAQLPAASTQGRGGMPLPSDGPGPGGGSSAGVRTPPSGAHGGEFGSSGAIQVPPHKLPAAWT